MSTVIEVNNLHKVYGSVIAVDNVSFEVHQGEIFGMVGPNGAGKTTTIECLEGLRLADSGYVKLLGLNPSLEHRNLSQRIGVQLFATQDPGGRGSRIIRLFLPTASQSNRLTKFDGLNR
jgi:ABC-2 type transport system ATP-binding protein